MIAKMKQYKNLILLALAAISLIILVASDPLGYCTRRAHERAAIRNEMAVEKAEAEKKIAIIKAQTDAQLERIRQGLGIETEELPEESTEAADAPGQEGPDEE